MITVTTFRGDHRLDEAEAESPEAAVVAARTMLRDDMSRWHHAFRASSYVAHFYVDGWLVQSASYSTLIGTAA